MNENTLKLLSSMDGVGGSMRIVIVVVCTLMDSVADLAAKRACGPLVAAWTGLVGTGLILAPRASPPRSLDRPCRPALWTS